MRYLLHSLITRQADATPDAIALGYRDTTISYAELAAAVTALAAGLQGLDLARGERVAIYLPKLPEAVVSFFAASAAAAVFVPINPVLKPEQVSYILQDCNVRVLITQATRYGQLQALLPHCHDLQHVLLVDGDAAQYPDGVLGYDALCNTGVKLEVSACIDTDMAAILYTSGSTGKPKGVVLSHRNLLAGADSVAQYLENTPVDRLLAVLPFSFDYGFSQLTTAFSVGASCYLLEYLMPRDIPRAVARYGITGLAAVPPLWVQLAELDWSGVDAGSLRYFTNSGGAMPTATLKALRRHFPAASPFLMYGLTEAFRSSFLPPREIEQRPTSMGKAIPNAELLVINEAGERCGPHEPGELVHRGSLVAMGYWGDSERTAERFRPAPLQAAGLPIDEPAVWSGDTVKLDEDGFLYFIARKDDMIKSSGYRVSPTELEEVLYASGLVAEAAAIGVLHQRLGQGIVVVAVATSGQPLDTQALLAYCRQKLPAYMLPQQILEQDDLARNPNGKIDRKLLAQHYRHVFNDESNGESKDEGDNEDKSKDEAR